MRMDFEPGSWRVELNLVRVYISAGGRHDLLQGAAAEMLCEFLLRCRLALHHCSLTNDRPANRYLRITRRSVPATFSKAYFQVSRISNFQCPNFVPPYASMVI